MTLRSKVTLLALGALFAAGPAWADDRRAIDAAKRSFEVGQDQYKRNDLEGARISFAQSYAAWPAIETLRLLAITELNTNHFVDALKHFKMYAKDKNADPQFVKDPLPEFIARCNTHVGHIRVTTSPGAIILVDGRRVYDLTEAVDVMPGDHTVGFRGAPPRSVSVGALDFVELTMGAPPAAVASAPASPETPPPVGLPRANHAEEGSTGPGFWTARNEWAAGLGGAAVVSAAIGVGFGVDANSKRSSFSNANGAASGCNPTSTNGLCMNLMQTASTQRTDAYASQVALGLAGAFAVSAVVVLVAWPHAGAKRGATWVAPSVGQGSGGLVAGGSF